MTIPAGFFFRVGLLVVLILVAGVQGSPVGGTAIFPADHIWNVPIDRLPVDTRSADYLGTIGTTRNLHPDFGAGLYEGAPMGIPYNIVDSSVPKQAVAFDYDDESDPGPYPVPANPLIEGGGGSDGDRHLLMVDRDEHILYELYAAEKHPDGSWTAGSGAIFDLDGYALRPAGWTSTDAAGLAVLPGLVRYDEVAAGEITHAIRFTAPQTQRAYVWPARHYASSITDPRYPPMGQRFRLKASFDTAGYPPQSRVILGALKKYGMILSDNGGAWYITGAPDDRWDNDDLHTLQQVKGSDFEAVDESSLMIDPDSGRASVASPEPVALPGQALPPADPDQDGIYEDLNGNGLADYADIVLFFHQLDWIAASEPAAAFDENENGRVEFDDIVLMFREL
jgi:PKD repeat protein